MKTSIIFISVFLLIKIVHSQEYYTPPTKSNYYFENNYQWTGSGYGKMITNDIVLKSEEKSLGFGVICRFSDLKITGVHVGFKIYSKYEPINKKIIFFSGYNFFYNTSMAEADYTEIKKGSTSILIENPAGEVGTMEHYLVKGIEIKLLKKIWVVAEIGAGIYVGTLDKKKGSGTPGVHLYNTGLTFKSSIGIIILI